MKGTKRRRAAGVSGDRCAPGRCAATSLMIAGLLLVVAGTVFAYSEWQAQAEVPVAFGPDAATQVARVEAIRGDEAETELPAEGAVILPPLEIAPDPAVPEEERKQALPLLRRESAGSGTGEAEGRRAMAAGIPRVPSWVDSTYSEAPGDAGKRPEAAERGASPPTAAAQARAEERSYARTYPPPVLPDVSPTMLTPEPAATPTPTPTPPPTATPTPPPTPYPAANAPPTRIQVPAISLDTPVVPVGWREVEYRGQLVRVWNVADHAAGWHETSLFPGQPGNVVISGHNNIRGEVFRDIVNLEAGAEVILTAEERPYTYVVESKMVIPEKGRPFDERLVNNRWIGYFGDERLTLVTCWPYTSNTHRVIVIARPRR